MNFQNYFPQSYYQNMYAQPVMLNPILTPTQQQPQTQPNNSIVWCQGEAGAKSYQVAPNQSVLLMDAEKNTFFIKSADASGMPLPLRIFDYTERTQQQTSEPQVQNQNPVQTQDYITREEFEERIAEIMQTADKKTAPQRKDKVTT